MKSLIRTWTHRCQVLARTVTWLGLGLMMFSCAKLESRDIALTKEASLRRFVLSEISSAIAEFKAMHGKWPRSDGDLFAVRPSLVDDIFRINYSNAGRYQVDYDKFQTGRLEILVSDPGYHDLSTDVPGQWRYALLTNGAVVSYDRLHLSGVHVPAD